LFIYDAIITFDREVACFWTAKRIGASRLLFFANKWISMAVYVMLLSQFAYFSSDEVSRLSTCSLFTRAGYAIDILQIVPGAAFSALRAYVLSQSKFLGLLVAVLSLAPVGANLVHYGYQFAGFYFAPFGCLGTDNITSAFNLRNRTVVFASRVPLIVADVILIYITWTKLRNWGALRDIHQSKRLSLSDILFRGGTIYFVVLFILNLLHLVLSATAMAGNGYESYVTEFTAPFTAILISRFLLKLQEANRVVVRLDPDDPLHSSRNPYDTGTPSFISSLGGFINPDLLARSEDDGVESHVGSCAETMEEDSGAHGSQIAGSSSSA
ncbi:hypothetical protein C8T65DRAFT_584944, partial [Cerioporus squamosus]